LTGAYHLERAACTLLGVSQIAQWLETLGLSEYAAIFAENRIDLSILPDITDEDLKELGLPLGDRRRLMRAIGQLSAASAPPADGAERRQLTLMFCDLVGSTALSGRLDPEDLREVIAAYHRCCAATVERAGGFVAKYMGDGVLVYFGYPQAHEDDAERAVQAALSLVEAVPKLVTPAGGPLDVRVGIATGLVIVGDLIGQGEAQERGVVGETPNLAARLQGIARPGGIVIAEGTRRLVGDLFEVEDLGPQDLKGIAGRVGAWSVCRAQASKSRFEALHGGALVELTGRKSESDLLARCWDRAARGEGQLVLLSGEPGIGKSRLVADLLDNTAAARQVALRYFCSPQHTASAFYPVIGQLEREAPASPLLSDLAGAADTSGTLTPAQRRQRTLEALVGHVEGLAQAGPLLAIFEDAHWADPSSLEFLGRIVDRLGGLRAMLVVTFRPEFVPPWSDAVALTLGRLSADTADAMIDRVADGRPVAPELRRRILERADGIPLFVQEMTRAALEADTQSVPASLQASLQARLDRLGEAREVAQLGAAIGREFSHDLLAAVWTRTEASLDTALDSLMAAGLLFRHGPGYQFNHALVQDAAYAGLLREQRRTIHGRIATTLESDFGDLASMQPELLARHWAEAGRVEKAAALWSEAGRRSLRRSALLEAADQLARALGLFDALPGTPDLRRLQIRAQVDLSNALIHTKGHANPQTQAAFERARSLMEQAQALGEPPEDSLVLYSILYGSWVAHRMKFQADVVLPLAHRFQELAAADRATVPVMIGHMIAGISLVLAGKLAEGRAELDRAIALYDPAEHRSLATRFGHDVRVSAAAWRAIALLMLGDEGGALADVALAVTDARKVGQAASLMFALSHGSLTLLHMGRHEPARELIDELIAVADRAGTLYWRSYGVLLQGWLANLTGHPEKGVQTIIEGIDAVQSTGATAYAPWYLSILAQAYADTGRSVEARRCAYEAIAVMEATGERWCEPDIRRRADGIAAP
jgi:class 3 adenylate cyclase/tetratricopeptide (TPR) repeat protein